MPFLSKKNDFKPIVFISFIINIILLLISSASILSMFPTSVTQSLNNINSLNTVYLITRRIRITDFLTQADAIFIFIWTSAIFCYISFLVRSIIYILNKLFSFESKEQTVFPISSIILGFCLIANKINIIKLLETKVFKYSSIILIFGICFVILLLRIFQTKKKEESK